MQLDGLLSTFATLLGLIAVNTYLKICFALQVRLVEFPVRFNKSLYDMCDVYYLGTCILVTIVLHYVKNLSIVNETRIFSEWPRIFTSFLDKNGDSDTKPAYKFIVINPLLVIELNATPNLNPTNDFYWR